MEFFLLPIPIWLVLTIYGLALLESGLAIKRYMAHWGIFFVQAAAVIGYTFSSQPIQATVQSVGILQYALFLQLFVIILAFYGAYNWYKSSKMSWKYEHEQTAHILDNSPESNQYKKQPVRFLTFSHYVALTFVVIILWLFLARIYSMEISVRASNQGLVGLIAFVLTLHYIGNFLLAHFFLEGWILRSLARAIEILFLVFKGMASPDLLTLLIAVFLVNLLGWWVWRKIEN